VKSALRVNHTLIRVIVFLNASLVALDLSPLATSFDGMLRAAGLVIVIGLWIIVSTLALPVVLLLPPIQGAFRRRYSRSGEPGFIADRAFWIDTVLVMIWLVTAYIIFARSAASFMAG